MSPKKATFIAWSVVGVLVLLSVGSASAYMNAKSTVQKEAAQIIKAENNQKPATVDYRAIAFLNGFVSSYFNYSSDSKTQSTEMTALNAYYAGGLTAMAQGYQKNASTLVSGNLMSLTDNEATYDVIYKVGSNQSEIYFTVPYAKEGMSYVVTSYPEFATAPKSLIQSQVPNVALNATSTVSSEENSELTTFVTAVFQAKCTSTKALELLASGLSVSSQESLKSVDYTYFQKQGNGAYSAVVQATFSDDLGTHPENFVFTITKENKSYFASHFSSVITAGNVATK